MLDTIGIICVIIYLVIIFLVIGFELRDSYKRKKLAKKSIELKKVLHALGAKPEDTVIIQKQRLKIGKEIRN